MATVYLKVDIDRIEGKSMSTELVVEELISEWDMASVQVEDSEYEVQSIEEVENPKARGPKGSGELGIILDALVDAYMTAFPLAIGEEDAHEATDEELQQIYRLVRLVITDPSARKLVEDARRKSARS
jgi:hypothetical protein